MATLQQIAEWLQAELSSGWSPASATAVEIDRVAAASSATATSLVFAEDEASLARALASSAAAVLTRTSIFAAGPGKPALLVDNPRLAFARVARMLRAPAAGIENEIHPTAVIGSDVKLGIGIRIGAGCVLGDGVRLGDGCHLYPRVIVYSGTTLGARVVVHAGAVLGSDGFGYVRDSASGEYVQFPQQGTLLIEDDVEIGANTTIDRGALEQTRIGTGTKIDNLVHIGHNVVIGRNVVIAAQTGISGSSTLGDGAVVAGQVGIADHVTVGPGVILGAQCGVPTMKKISGPGQLFWGTPARPIQQYLRELATLARVASAGAAREKATAGKP